jgi:DNA-binding transcriptional LysR family regulator
MIDRLQHIKSFITVARLRNFASASRELYLSPPALTAHIQQLETELGVKLFSRTTRKIELTQAGNELLVPLERVLVEIQVISTSAGDFKELRRGLVSVAAVPSVAAKLLPQAIAEFSKSYPGISVRFTDAVAKNIVELVVTGQVDFGVGSQIHQDDDVATRYLYRESICVFVTKKHPWASRRKIRLREVSTQELILTEKDTSVRLILERAFERQKTFPRFHYETNNMSTALGMVSAGLGIAILPQSAIDCGPCENIRSLEISDPKLTRDIGILTRSDRPLSKASEKLVETILKHAVALSLIKSAKRQAR